MSGARREELVDKLVWSGEQYQLAEFVDNHPLPQVVCIEEGYYGAKELTSFGSDQVLTLHALRTRTKLLGEDNHGQALTISLECPTKVHVHPLPADCKYQRVDADQLTLVFPPMKYFYVLDGHYKDEDESFESGDILEITAIDTIRQVVKGQNVSTDQNLTFSLTCGGSFEPILDPRLYTLAEVKAEYGLPAKISFREADDKLSQALSQCGEMLLLGELDETVVIATTVGRGSDARVCHLLQKDLGIEVCVAEGFLAGDETYASVVNNLHEDVQIKNLFDFDYRNAHQNRIADGSKYVPVMDDLLDREPTESVLRKHAEMRLKPLSKHKQPPTKHQPPPTKHQPPPPVVPRRKKNLHGAAPPAAPKPLLKSLSLPLPYSARSRVTKLGVKTPGGKYDAVDGDSSDDGAYELVPENVLASKSSSSYVTSRGKTKPGVINSGGKYNPVDGDSSDDGAYELVPENVLASKSSSLSPQGSVQSGRTPRGPDLRVETPGGIYDTAGGNLSDKDDYEDVDLRMRRLPPNYVSPVDKPSQHFGQRELPKLPTEGADNKPVQPSLEKLLKLLPRRPTPSDNKLNNNKKAPADSDHVAVPKSQKPEIPPKLPERTAKSTSSHANQSRTGSSQTLTPLNLRRKVKHLSDSAIRRSKSHDELAHVQKDYESVFDNDFTEQPEPPALLSSRESPQSSRDPKACRDEIYARVARIPIDLKGLTVEGVAELLVDLNMEGYVETFESEMIDGDMLKSMDLNTLQSLGINLFHSTKLMKFIEGWRPALRY